MSPESTTIKNESVTVKLASLIHTLSQKKLNEPENQDLTWETISGLVEHLEKLLIAENSTCVHNKVREMEEKVAKSNEQCAYMEKICAQLTNRMIQLESSLAALQAKKDLPAPLPNWKGTGMRKKVLLQVSAEVKRLADIQEELQQESGKNIEEGMQKLLKIESKVDELVTLQQEEDEEVSKGISMLASIEKNVNDIVRNMASVNLELKELKEVSEACLNIH